MLQTPYSYQGGGGAKTCHLICLAAKFSKIFMNSSAYVKIGLLSWLLLVVDVHADTTHETMHASPPPMKLSQ